MNDDEKKLIYKNYIKWSQDYKPTPEEMIFIEYINGVLNQLDKDLKELEKHEWSEWNDQPMDDFLDLQEFSHDEKYKEANEVIKMIKNKL